MIVPKIFRRRTRARVHTQDRKRQNLLAAPSDPQAQVFAVLVGYLVFVFLTGGGARYDVQSLMVLRPMSVLVCGYATLTLRWNHVRHYRFMAVIAALVLILCGLQMVPLPPATWQSLPGREFVLEVEAAAGLHEVWRPLTLTPAAGLNAFFSLFVPLAAFLLIIQLDSAYVKKLLVPILLIGGLSGLLGVAQVAGSPDGPLYLYRITNTGSAVGLFANRNHQALFLATLLPMMALYAAQSVRSENEKKMRYAAVFGGIAMLVPLLLVTGSRQGLLLGIIGLISCVFIFRQPVVVGARQRTERRSYGHFIAAFAGLLLLTLLTVVASRAVAIQRLLATNVEEESRLEAWKIIAQQGSDFAPFGSGIGSFVPVFSRAEPLEFLRPQYFNHAHNDFLEIWLTLGLPGITILALAVAAFLWSSRKLVRAVAPSPLHLPIARTGAAIVLLCGIASSVDYPLRVPSLACFFVVACCWFYNGLRTPTLSNGNDAKV